MNEQPEQPTEVPPYPPLPLTIMILCPICGNKRCPKAENDKFKCTNSNEVGQIGEVETT